MKKLLEYSEKLKHLPRTGWLKMGIDIPETVASHSWQMALMALNCSSNKEYAYDFNKVIKLCLCHDLAESIVGDITPNEETYKEKPIKEREAIKQITKDCAFPELLCLFEEYEENQTPEAQLAHDLDKLDMYAQAQDYEKKYPKKDFSEFKISAISQIQTHLGRKLLQDIAK